MSNNLFFLETSVFLCKHGAFKLFAENYVKNCNFSNHQNWFIVCERNEDVDTVRTQILIEIEKISSLKIHDLNHISIYTLDTLAQKICSSLSHIKDKTYRAQIPSSLFKPYLDIYSQEKLTEIILNLFGYNSSDSFVIARQILTLLDVQLPAETSLLEVILATQERENIKKIQHITEISLRQILATIQQTQIELAQHARFQTLVNEYLIHSFLGHVHDENFQKDVLLPLDIFNSPLLWVGAPEYLDDEKSASFLQDEKNSEKNREESIANRALKLGNFQRYLVDEFKNKIKMTRELMRPSHLTTSSLFYDSRTVLGLLQENKEMSSNVYLSSNDHKFLQATEELISNKNENNFVLLADFDPQGFQAIHKDGGGSYSITKKDLENWKCKIKHTAYFEEISHYIDKKHDQFLNILAYVQNNDSLQKIASIYSLNIVEINEDIKLELFNSYLLKEKITIGNKLSLLSAPKVLSYFNGKIFPQKVICIGGPHHPVAQSFHVRVLNQAFFILKQKGIDIDIPASETMYRIFWINLVCEIQDMEFWIASKKDLEKFPKYLKIKNVSALNSPLPSHFDFNFQLNKKLTIPLWKTRFLWGNQKEKSLPHVKKPDNRSDNISITQFEDYVHCPHKFFLKHLLKIKRKEPSESVNFKEIGTNMHKISEQLITRLVILFGNKGYVEEVLPVLDGVIETLKEEKLFLSFDKNVWLEAISKRIIQMNKPYSTELILAMQESIDLIWQNQESSSFAVIQEREILKRTFLKLLLTEKSNLMKNNKIKVGLYREVPIYFEFAGFNFLGRIDRIDLTSEGLEIIDYKTSNITKSQKQIVLMPQEAQARSNTKLSVQGALYSYGFAKSYFTHSEDAEDEPLLQKIKYYSLYFLKNLDESKENCLKYDFKLAFEKQNTEYLAIENDYSEYAKNLLEGQFSVNPLQGEITCLFCEFKMACPNTYLQNTGKT